MCAEAAQLDVAFMIPQMGSLVASFSFWSVAGSFGPCLGGKGFRSSILSFSNVDIEVDVQSQGSAGQE